jgi:alkylation response protein AidB-like acyl-CoA dehydrogenase
MDFAFSEEQEMLRGAARDWFQRTHPMETVARLADAEGGWDPESWPTIAELGWLGFSLPHQAGGGGMTFLEEAVLLEEAGRALYPGPLFSTVALALPILAEARSPLLAEVLRGRRAATLAWAETEADRIGAPERLECVATASETSGNGAAPGGGWTLRGRKLLVPDLALADDAVVVAAGPGGEPGLWRVDLRANPTAVVPRSTMDRTRRLGELVLEATPADLLIEPGRATDLLRQVRPRALAAAACEAAGVAQAALSVARAHASERRQFGRPIGSYQAISHRVADVYVAVELARSLAYRAAWCVAVGDEAAELACAEAKAQAGETAVFACESAIQVLGGIGFTWERQVHRWYKRAQWLEAFEGHGAEHRARIAAALLDAEPAAVSIPAGTRSS